MKLKPTLVIAGILVVLILLHIFNVFRLQDYISPVSDNHEENKVETFGDNKDSMNVTYEKNKDKADYQELASYTQKTNHGDFMYKDFTTALPPDFNRNKCPSLDAAANGGELL